MNQLTINAPLPLVERPMLSDVAKMNKLRRSFFPAGIKHLTKVLNALHTVVPILSYKMTMGCLSISIKSRLKNDHLNFYKRGTKIPMRCGNKKFNVYLYGEGPKVLMLHGWASGGYRWRDYVNRIVEKGFQVVVMDAPGHATSKGRLMSIPDYIKCIRYLLSSHNCWHSVVGHSIGSLIGSIALTESGITLSSGKFVAMSSFSDCEGLFDRYGRCIGLTTRLRNGFHKWILNSTGKPMEYYSLPKHILMAGVELKLFYDANDIVVPIEEAQKITKITQDQCEVYRSFNYGHSLNHQEVKEKVIDLIIHS